MPKRTWGYTFPPFPVGSGLGAMPPPAVLSKLALGSTGGPETPGGGEPAGAGAGGPPDSAGGQPLQPATPSTGSVAVFGADWETAAGPFVLGEGIPPVPAKVVAQIWKGEYIDMADLLRDNLEADRRRATAQRGAQQQGQAKATRLEVPDLLSWAQCFSEYVGVAAEKHPHRVKQLLAYQATILREARRCGGNGWRAYDAMFWQLAATDDTIDWSRLNPSLYATSFMVQQGGGSRICHLCMGADHVQDDCALAPLQTNAQRMVPADARDERPVGHSGNRQSARDSRPRRQSDQACYLWNDERCQYPYCRYRHVCLRCRGDHRVPGCTLQSAGLPPLPPHGVARF